MQQQRMGVVVIGQSPRPSVVNEIAAVLSPGLEIDLRGALDGMTRAEIDAIPPSDGHDALFTLLPNGDSVTISKKAVEARAAIQIENFAREGVREVEAQSDERNVASRMTAGALGFVADAEPIAETLRGEATVDRVYRLKLGKT